MKKIFTLLAVSSVVAFSSQAQIGFDPEIDFEIVPDKVIVPASPLTRQVIFIGGVDMVQTVDTYGNLAGATPAKQWHDFIGFTPDNSGSGDLGWVSVNHEMIQANDNIGDGGGMTVFKVRRHAGTDSLIVVDQTLTDGRSGQFFNVDFANTVGETGMNCGGINSEADGRIWTAEEWFRADNSAIYGGGAGVRDTLPFTIANSGISMADGQTIDKFQNFNWMVEIDPVEARAIRKQYNWGRQPFEGGVILPDNQTVYLGADDTPGYLTKFIATTPGDFTEGTLYVYKADAPTKWVEITNNFNDMLNYKAVATSLGATMFNRLEWVAYNEADGNIYLTETGRDNPASRWADEYADGATLASHHIARAQDQGVTDPLDAAYADYYGRVIMLDVLTDEISVVIEGGPEYSGDVTMSNYPAYHLSNPDGLTFMSVGAKTYMVICEDLNGTSNGRMPAGVSNRSCELFILDMDIQNPTPADLVRIAQVPFGAEVTGARATPDGETLLFNSQHPSSSNPYPYNNSCTIAITGWKRLADGSVSVNEVEQNSFDFNIFPNPTSRVVHFNRITDVALYSAAGKLMKVERNTKSLDILGLPAGNYFLKNAEGQTKQLVIQ